MNIDFSRIDLCRPFKRLAGFYTRLSSIYTRNQILFILDAVLINASIILTTGVFISGYIVFLKGSDFLVGILNSSSNWASIVALFSFLIYEGMKRRKKLLLTLLAISRLLICSVIFLPLVFGDGPEAVYAAAVMVIAGNILWGIYSIGWTVWFVSTVPKEMRNDFLYTRMFYLRIAFTLTTIVMGFILDLFQKGYTGFLIVFCSAMAFSIIDLVTLINIEEPEYPVNGNERFNPAMFLEPIRNQRYRRFLQFVFLFYVFLTMSSSYTPLYLIKYMNLDYGLISTINVAAYIVMIISTGLWKRVENKKSIEFVLRTTAIFIALEFFVYAFVVRERLFLLCFSPIFSGLGNGGFNVCILTYRYEIMPEENRTVYEGWFGAVFGLSTFTAPFIGGILINTLPSVGNVVFRYGNFQLLYLASFLLAVCVIFFFFSGPRNYRIGRRENAGTPFAALAPKTERGQL